MRIGGKGFRRPRRERNSGTWLDHFGLIAPLYERFIRPPEADRLHDLLDLGLEDVILDVGGGTGRVAQRLLATARAVYVLDVSDGMLQQAAAKAALGPCLGAAEAIPFRTGAFRRIVAVDSFHHFGDQGQATRELLRVLAPGGRLVIEEPDIRRFSVKLVALGERLMLMRSRFRSVTDLVALFSSLETVVSVHESAPNVWIVVERRGRA